MELKNTRAIAAAFVCAASLLAVGATGLQIASRAVEPDGELKSVIVARVCADLEKTYVYAEDAVSMARLLRANLSSGEYSGLPSLKEFAERLTLDLRSVRPDQHLEISVLDEGQSSDMEVEDHQDPAYLRRHNFRLREIEVLSGNVGYLALDGLADGEGAEAAGVAAMNFLAHADALIIDLRENGGGGITMIQLLMSYLHEGREQLSGIYIRESDTAMEFWTHDVVSGPRLADIPVWVLVSARTFSAAEALAYDIKHMGRGIIVGEVTRGGAHLARNSDYPALGISVRVPFARAVSPKTGGNWEGVGVQPDLRVPAAEALAVAHAEAVRSILQKEQDPRWRAWLERALVAIEGGGEPREH
jgi:C-terminal processing protease CtpA/Prc